MILDKTIVMKHIKLMLGLKHQKSYTAGKYCSKIFEQANFVRR